MKIETAYPGHPLVEKLNAFVSKHQLFFHAEKWIRNYPALNFRQCGILNNNNELIGCFMYYQFKKGPFKLIITPPFSPNIGLFYVNPSESVVGKNSFTKELLEIVAAHFNDLGAQHTELCLPYTHVDTQPFIWKGYMASVRYTYLIDLALDEKQLWDNLSSEKRKSVNRATKDGLVIRESTDFEMVYELIVKSLGRNELLKNLQVLKRIITSYGGSEDSVSYTAYDGSKPIGATLSIIHQDRAIYLFGGFDSDHKHHGAGVSCMWHSILKSKNKGLRYFDFEGSMNARIERYFREFGGTLVPYFTVGRTSFPLNLLFLLKRRA